MEKLWEKVINWASQELREVRRAPVAFAIVAVIGVGVAWWGSAKWYGNFYGERFNVMEQRIAALQQELATKASTPTTVPAAPPALSQQSEPVTTPPPTAKRSAPSKPSPPKTRTPVSPPKPDEKVSVGSNSVVSVGQQGGITTGTMNVTTNVPPTTYDLKAESVNKPTADGKYETRVLLTLHTEIAVPRLGVRIDSPSLVKADLGPTESGIMALSTSYGEGFYAFIVQGALGAYRITIVTSKPETPTIQLARLQ